MKTACAVSWLALGSTALACTPGDHALPLTPLGDGLPPAFVEVGPVPISHPFALRLLICSDAVLAVRLDAIMPAHQHGMNYSPTVSALGGRRFEVSGMVFHMPGHWELQVSATTDGKTYRYTTDLTAP